MEQTADAVTTRDSSPPLSAAPSRRKSPGEPSRRNATPKSPRSNRGLGGPSIAPAPCLSGRSDFFARRERPLCSPRILLGRSELAARRSSPRAANKCFPAAMRVNLELLMPLMAQYTAPTWATLVAGFFVLLALSLSMYLIFEHLSAYNNPEVICFSITELCHQFFLPSFVYKSGVVFFEEKKVDPRQSLQVV